MEQDGLDVSIELSAATEPDGSSARPRYIVTFDDEHGDARRVRLVIDTPPDGLRVVELTVEKETGVCSRDIRIPLDRYLSVLVGIGGDLSGASSRTLGLRGLAASIDDRRKGRRVSDDFLRKVAAAYRAAGDNVAGINETVDPAFTNAVESTKYRWVKAARERGLLTDETEG